MNARQHSTFERLQTELSRLEFSEEFAPSLIAAIQSRDQYFRLRGFWAEGAIRKNCDLYFYKLDGNDEFILDHYRLSVRADIPIPVLQINGIDTSALDQKMRAIDWFTLSRAKGGPDELTNQHVLNNYISDILEDLYSLDKDPDGKPLALLLKAKYLSNTLQIVGSATQEELDQIDRRFSKTLIVPVRGNNDPLPYSQALQRLESATGAVETPVHELFLVYTNGFVQRTTAACDALESIFHEKRYFTSLLKAYEHVQTVDEGLFAAGVGQDNVPKKLSGKSVLYDGMDDEVLAMKFGMIDQHRPGNVVIGWYLNPAKMTAASFEQQTGLRLSLMEQANSESLIYLQSASQRDKLPHIHDQTNGKNWKPPRDIHGRGL